MNYQGILDRFEKKAIPLYGKPSGTVFEPVIGEQVVQMHFILFSGIFAAIAIAVLEIYLKKRRSNRKKFDIEYIYAD